MANNEFFVEFKSTSKAGKKAAIYVRVSRNEYAIDDAGEKELRQSVKNQKDDGIRHCEREGWEYELYDKDCELSGTFVAGPMLPKGKRNVRPDLDRLLNDVKAGKIHTVIVRDIKRLARNTVHLKEIIFKHLIPKGVVLHGLSAPLDITTPEGRVFVTMLGEFAELEIYNTRKASMRGREGSARDGKLNLGANTYGYQNLKDAGGVQIVPSEAAIVKRVYSMFVTERRSCRQIANILNLEKVPTKFNGIKSDKRDFRDSMWAEFQIWKMVKNPRYIGKITFNDELCESPFPPIVTQKLWDAAKDERDRRKLDVPRARLNRHLMTGILYCGYCLENLVEKRAKGWDIRPKMIANASVDKRKQTTHPYYACQTKCAVKGHYCRGIRVPKKKIEDFIEAFIGSFAESEFSKATVTEPEVVTRIETELRNQKATLKKLNAKMESLSKKFIETENMHVDVLVKASVECKKSIVKVEKEIQSLEKQLSDLNHEDAVRAFGILKKWKSLDIQSRRAALHRVLPKAVMYEDRLELFLANLGNRPVIAKYERLSGRINSKDFPTITDKWPTFIGDGKMLRFGAEMGDGLKAYVD